MAKRVIPAMGAILDISIPLQALAVLFLRWSWSEIGNSAKTSQLPSDVVGGE
jgi:hypothetical protein